MTSTHVLQHLTASFYLANAGIPFFTQSLSYQVFLLIPIVAIEAYVYQKLLRLPIVRSALIALGTNIISTLGGILLVLPVSVFLSTLIFGSSVPVQPGSFPFLPLEIMVTLIPLFFFSVFLESSVGRRWLKGIARDKANRSFWVANAFSYLMLEILAVAQLVKGYIEGRG